MAQTDNKQKKSLVIFASPKCTEEPMLYKAYFNVAWFVRAYRDLLKGYEILTTEETKEAVEKALEDKGEGEHNPDGYWNVPENPNILAEALTEGERGFDGQVWLMGEIVRGNVERVLMFMDPLDTKEYLPETYAFIRNCTLADVGIHINVGATYWAESVRPRRRVNVEPGYGYWRRDSPPKGHKSLHTILNSTPQNIHFIAHDSEKIKLARFVYHYRQVLADRAGSGWKFRGTFGTCSHIEKYLAEHVAPYAEKLGFQPAGTETTAHGPTGGDVVIADEVRNSWPVREVEGEDKKTVKVLGDRRVRDNSITQTVLFFIDYYRARPHETDIHVLLRTCLNPHRGVHLILNERSAFEWADSIRSGPFSDKAPEESGERSELE